MINEPMLEQNYPLININVDFSLYILLLLSLLLIIGIIIRLLVSKKNKKSNTKRDIIIARLCNLDFHTETQKQLAYDFTLLIKDYFDEVPEEVQEVFTKLEVYKYHNLEINIDEETKNKMKRVIDELSQ